MFQRLIDINAWTAIRYWSVSRQSWRPLALSVSVLDGVRGASDSVTAATLTAGENHRFIERDENGDEIIYSLRVLRRDSVGLTVAIDNVTPIRIAIITAFPPRALQTVTFVDRVGTDQWSTYQITRVGADASSLVLGHGGSFLNRLEAVRRHLASKATDRHPPLVPR